MTRPSPTVTVRLTFTDPVNGPARAVAALITNTAQQGVRQPQAQGRG